MNGERTAGRPRAMKWPGAIRAVLNFHKLSASRVARPTGLLIPIRVHSRLVFFLRSRSISRFADRHYRYSPRHRRSTMLQRGKAGLPFILVTVFLDMLGFGIVIPVLPALVGSMIADKPSQAYWYGALLASYGLAQFVSAPLLGAVSDRFGRRSVLLVSIFGLGVNFLITALSPWLVLLLVSRLIGGASGASYTVAGAYIADITTPENRSRSFGLMGAVFGLGFICGPLIGGVLATNSLRLPYLVAAGLALLNWIYGFFILPESLPKDRRTAFDLKKANPLAAILALTKI